MFKEMKKKKRKKRIFYFFFEREEFIGLFNFRFNENVSASLLIISGSNSTFDVEKRQRSSAHTNVNTSI